MKQRSLVAFAMGVVVLAACPASAEETQEEGLRLSLTQCLETALTNNLDLVIARKDPRIAELQVDVRQAKFDGVIGASANWNKQTEDSTIRDNVLGGSSDGTADNKVLNASVSWGQLLNFGGSYSATLSRNDTNQSSIQINQFTGFFQDTAFDFTQDGLALHYEMPLLQGLGREVNTVDVLLARSGLDISKQDLRLQAMRTMKDVEDAYWDLLAAREALGVARESLKLAQDLLDLNRKKVEVGTMAPIEITQAEAGVAAREEGVIVAETGVQNAEDSLRRLLAIPKDDPAWSRTIVLTDSPKFEERPVDVEAVLATAMESRPEMVTARQRLKDSELQERVAKSQVRHSLRLAADLAPSRSDDHFRQSILFPPGIPPTDSATNSDGRQWQVGLTYGFPVGNHEGKANYAIATLNREKSDVNVRNVEQSVRVDVRTAVRSVESGIKRVAAAKASSLLQRKTLDAEHKKFENGMSTSFEVLRIQTDLSNAQFAEIQAILDYNKALADLERARGTLLEARGLRLE